MSSVACWLMWALTAMSRCKSFPQNVCTCVFEISGSMTFACAEIIWNLVEHGPRLKV